ncbi:MAG: hypothetical protein IT455_14055 [Planctomycetes bacterium]|nr:hypothetical protein [Planctomycetota bacterium]
MVSHGGAEVSARLQHEAAAARAVAAGAAAAAQRVLGRMQALDAERMQTLRELALTQLPELNGATAGQTMPELVAEMQRFERQRQQRATELAASLEAASRRAAAQETALQQVGARLDAALAHRDGLLAEVGRRLAGDAAYAAACSEATQAEVRLARDTARAEELRHEAKQKLPDYEHSRLFQYLWRREFGTPQYRSRGFVARVDRRLAEYIGFAAAAASYRFLLTTPKLVALEVERRTAEVRQLRARIEAAEQTVEDAVGAPAAEQEVERLAAERARAADDLAATTREVAALRQRSHDEAGSRGAFHAEALQRLTGFLARAEAVKLEHHARATPDARDDQLVATLRQLTAELGDVGAEAAALEAEAARTDAVADGLEDLLVRYRHAGFDSGRSEFEDLEVEPLLRDARDGRVSATDLWQRLQAKQRFRRPPSVHHEARSNDLLAGIGLALDLASVLTGGRSRRSRGGFGGFSSGGGFGGGGGGFSSGRGFGGGGGGFSSGRGF